MRQGVLRSAGAWHHAGRAVAARGSCARGLRRAPPSASSLYPARDRPRRDLRRPGRHRHRERAAVPGAAGPPAAAHPLGGPADGAGRGDADGDLHAGPGRGALPHRLARRAALRLRERRRLRARPGLRRVRAAGDLPAPRGPHRGDPRRAPAARRRQPGGARRGDRRAGAGGGRPGGRGQRQPAAPARRCAPACAPRSRSRWCGRATSWAASTSTATPPARSRRRRSPCSRPTPTSPRWPSTTPASTGLEARAASWRRSAGTRASSWPP